MTPPIEYAKSGDLHIAYQVVGDGSVDLVIVLGWVVWVRAHVERSRPRRGSSSRWRLATAVILFDQRGAGMSDRVSESDLPSLETRMDDVRAVMDAVGSERAVLFGISEGGPMSCVFAATYPERTQAMILHGAFARSSWAPDYPLGATDDEWEESFAGIESGWASGEFMREVLADVAPSLSGDERVERWFADACRRSARPGAVLAFDRMGMEMDGPRPPSGDPRADACVDAARRWRRVERPLLGRAHRWRAVGGVRRSPDHVPWGGDQEKVLAEFDRFLAGLDEDVDLDRVLATVLFTDIVGSTEHAVELGDRGWRGLVDEHDARVRAQLARFRGREVDTAGDGFFATFDGPARAIRCACAIGGTSA